MNGALWRKSLREGFWLWLGCAVVLLAFHWIQVWVTSQFRADQIVRLLRSLPDFLKNFFVVPLDVLATPAGRLAVSYDDPLVVAVVSIWAIARGSDAVSGEINRGTMELLLAQPVRRIAILAIHAATTVAGALLLAFAGWCGLWLGISTIHLKPPPSPAIFVPASLCVFGLGFFLAGFTTLCSACDRYRSRTIGIAVSFLVVETILKLLAKAIPGLEWLRGLTILTAYEPQKLTHAFWPEMLAEHGAAAWSQLTLNLAVFLVLGSICYAAAAAIFCRRDLPAPL